MKRVYILLILATVFFISGCSSKNKTSEYNKPAIYWYQKMIKSISHKDLDGADDYFTSLESEHIGSPLLKEAMLILAKAHMDSEEYLMANFYLDEYIKRYGNEKNREFAEYLKIKSKFLSFKNIDRDQKLLQDTIKKAKEFKIKYRFSEFTPLVDTILTKLYMADYILNKNIVDLYLRRDKPKAAQIYKKRLKESWINNSEIIVPTHWYDYLINW